MITFQEKEYRLFFSNNLEPLRALNYADERFFSEFERLSGSRYRILSVIRKGWQEKYGLEADITELRKAFEAKLGEPEWIRGILAEYEAKRASFEETLNRIASADYAGADGALLADELMNARAEVASLDAMSNMLHLFSSLVGDSFLGKLGKYSTDGEAVNQNFIFYTQPLKESKFAKILIPELPGKFALSAKDAALSEILRTGAFIKDDVSALLEERGEKLHALFEEIAKRLSIEASDAYYLTLEEIRDALAAGRAPDGLIESRRALTVIFYPHASLEIREGDGAETFLADGKMAEIAVRASSELKGQTASMGTAKGRAVVVKNSDEAIREMQQGDILVAPYTAPEYLPAMKRSGAIVTETGGITSHAAIVSRELKIPCVIGVADVMQLVKTGDQIEVDAGKGIVRIL